MPVSRPITIVGGGLAGLTLGIGLRQRNIAVTVWEAGRYPRHRVCGEFIHGRGLEVLGTLRLDEPMRKAGAVPGRTAAFFSETAQSPVRPLCEPALCLSRVVMDALLADNFRQSGGELRDQHRWTGDFHDEGIVRASGRRVRPVENGCRWFGLKAHARNLTLAADLEMHAVQDGYVGLCRLNDREVNVCGLFRRRSDVAGPARPWQELLRGAVCTLLNNRLSAAVFDERSFCSVAGLPLRPQRASALDECCLGDALTMIPPVTGNGMSIAFESAAIAIEPLAAYSRGEIGWRDAQKKIARACDKAFAQRLRWAAWLQWMMFTPLFRSGLGQFVLRSDWLWGSMLGHTR